MNETANQTVTKAEPLVDQLLNQLGISTTHTGGVEGAILFVGIIISSIIAAKAIYWIIERYMKLFASKTRSEVDDLLLRIIQKPLYLAIILIGIELATRSIDMAPEISSLISSFVSIAVIVVATIFIADLVCVVFLHGIGRAVAAKTKTTADDQAIPFLSKLLRFAIYLLAFIVILGQLNVEITPLVASLGVAGFAIGFAAQDAIGNILAGFFILADRPFSKGDRIEIKGHIGEVVDIGLRTTKIETLDQTYVVIPNAHIISNELINYALPSVEIKVRINIGVAYGTDSAKVKEILVKVGAENEKVLKKPVPEAYFLEFGDSSLNFQLIVWITDFRDKFAVIDYINTRINEEFKKAGVEIPFPCRNIYMRKED